MTSVYDPEAVEKILGLDRLAASRTMEVEHYASVLLSIVGVLRARLGEEFVQMPSTEIAAALDKRLAELIEAAEALDAHSHHGRYRCTEANCLCGLTEARQNFQRCREGR